MSDLTDEQLESMTKIGERGALMAKAAGEIKRHRAEVKEYAAKIIGGYLGAGLNSTTTEACADAIADRAAEQLAGVGVGLNDQERSQLAELRSENVVDDYPAACQAIDRLLTSPPAVDYLAGIRTILASDMPGEAMRRALEELAGLR